MASSDSQRIVLSADGLCPGKPAKNGAAVSRCHHLRPVRLSTGEKVLMPVAPLDSVFSSAWRPLARMQGSDGKSRIIVASGDMVGEVLLDTGGDLQGEGSVRVIAKLDVEPVCAVADASRLTVMTSRGQMNWIIGGNGEWLRVDISAWPALSLMAVDGADCSATVPARRLSADYSDRTRPLSDSDRRSLTSDLRRAYLDIARQAAASGAMCAPMLVRYRLVGCDGEILYVSPPQFLSPADSSRLTLPLSVHSSDRRRLAAYLVSARSWQLKVVSVAPFPRDMAEVVSRIEILASPQFHPFDDSAEASVSLVSETSSDEMLRITMPGACKSVSAGNALAAESRLKAAVGTMESLERVVAVIQGPLVAGATLDNTPAVMGLMRSVGDECRALDEAIARSDSQQLSVAAECLSAPHSFSARCGVSDAGYTLWGNLEALRFDGFPVESFAAERAGQGAWHAAVAVKFASGKEQVVALSSGTSGAPLRFNPLLSYPAADAVSMTLTVSAGGVVRSSTLPLVPDSSGRRAVYIRPSFTPFALENEVPAFIVPAVRRQPRPMSSYVAVCKSGAYASPIALSSLGAACVNDVFVASRARSSWDFSRPRFSVFAASGVYTLTIPGTRSHSLSLSRIDSRVIESGAACMVDGRLWAVADDTLVEVGVSALKDLVCSVDTDYMAYDSVNKELWLSSPQRAVTTVFSVETLFSYTRDEILASRSVDGFAVVNSSLCRLGVEASAQSVFIRWDGELPLSDRYVSPRILRLDMCSAKISFGSLTLRRQTVAQAESAPSLRLSLNGRLSSPLAVPLRLLPARRLVFSFQGRVSPDTLISSLTICNSPLWKQTTSTSLPKR